MLAFGNPEQVIVAIISCGGIPLSPPVTFVNVPLACTLPEYVIFVAFSGVSVFADVNPCIDSVVLYYAIAL